MTLGRGAKKVTVPVCFFRFQLMSAKLPVVAVPAALSRNASVSAVAAAAADVINVQIIAPPPASNPEAAASSPTTGDISADIMAQL